MRHKIYFILFLFLIAIILISAGCGGIKKNSEQWTKKQAMKEAEKYTRNKFKNPVRNVADNGSVIFSEGDVKCLVDPRNIITGKIDSDSTRDAIATVITFPGERLPIKDHLILMNNNGKLAIVKEYRGEMRFASINNQLIYIETSHLSADSPLANCQICKEIRKYRFISGDTVRVK